MSSKSLKEMTKGRMREFFREPSAAFFVILMPILWMVILGFSFSKPKVENFSIGFVAKDSPRELMEEYEKVFASHPSIHWKRLAENQIDSAFKNENVTLVVALDKSQLRYIYDPSNPDVLSTRRYIDDALQENFGRKDVISSTNEMISIPGQRYIDFLIPGLLAMSIFSTSLFGTGMTLVSNRRENLLKRYRATPMKSWEYILSQILGRYLIFFIEFATIIGFGALAFQFKIAGNFLAFFTFGLFATGVCTSLGILCGSRIANTSTYHGINNLIAIPMMMLSGIWYSRSNFPDWLRNIADYLPLSVMVDGLRKIALEGLTLSGVAFEIGLLGIYLVVFFFGAQRLFKWY